MNDLPRMQVAQRGHNLVETNPRGTFRQPSVGVNKLLEVASIAAATARTASEASQPATSVPATSVGNATQRTAREQAPSN